MSPSTASTASSAFQSSSNSKFHADLRAPVLGSIHSIENFSVNVFGISPESMQCGYDSKGNSVPTILLLMQERLYSLCGLKAEGIFRINPENGQEKEVREQLTKGILPDDIDVHCLASLIKAWFRELPEGVMDSLSPGQVLQCENEEDYDELVKLLPPAQYALFNWVIELMADVVEEEESNKMNVRNIAMVFAPNMTQLSDPLTSLIHAVQVMNLLKTLILKTLREREEQATEIIFWPCLCSPSSQGVASCQSSEEDVSDESSAYGEEHRMTCKKDVQENGGLGGDISDDCCSITEELAKDIEECFLNPLEWNEEICYHGEKLDSYIEQETLLCNPYFKAESSFSLSESNQDRDAEKMIEGHGEKKTGMHQEERQRSEVLFGTIVVGEAVKIIEENKDIKAESKQGNATIDRGLNFGKIEAEDADCLTAFFSLTEDC